MSPAIAAYAVSALIILAGFLRYSNSQPKSYEL